MFGYPSMADQYRALAGINHAAANQYLSQGTQQPNIGMGGSAGYGYQADAFNRQAKQWDDFASRGYGPRTQQTPQTYGKMIGDFGAQSYMQPGFMNWVNGGGMGGGGFSMGGGGGGARPMSTMEPAPWKPGLTGALQGKPLFSPYNNGDFSTQESGTLGHYEHDGENNAVARFGGQLAYAPGMQSGVYDPSAMREPDWSDNAGDFAPRVGAPGAMAAPVRGNPMNNSPYFPGTNIPSGMPSRVDPMTGMAFNFGGGRAKSRSSGNDYSDNYDWNYMPSGGEFRAMTRDNRGFAPMLYLPGGSGEDSYSAEDF